MISPDDFFKYYLHWAEPAKLALERGRRAAEDLSEKIELNLIVFCGMGGSGAAGLYAWHLLNLYSATPSLAVMAHKLPRPVGGDSLVFALSFSGNTRETLECALEAASRDATVVAVTRGGKLAELAGEKGFTLVELPEAPAPRAGFPGLFYSILGVLEGLGVIDGDEIGVGESLVILEEARAEAGAEAERLGDWIASSEEPLIVVTGYTLYPVVVRLKNELAENTKLASMIGYFPESGHNDIEAWSRLSNARMLIIESPDRLEQIMIDAALAIIKPSSSLIVATRGEKPVSQLLWPTWVGGLASVDAAIRLNRDPVSISEIGNYKKAWTSAAENILK